MNRKKMALTEKCELCEGYGMLMSLNDRDEFVIERCDECQAFKNDEEAQTRAFEAFKSRG